MKQTILLLAITPFTVFATPKEKQLSENKPKMISVKNCITKDQLKVRKMMQWHYPKYFRVHVNGKAVRAQQEVMVPENKAITVQYDYEWYIPWGNKIGSKQVRFTPKKEASSLSLHFNGWEHTERITLTNAKRQESEVGISSPSITFSAEDVY